MEKCFFSEVKRVGLFGKCVKSRNKAIKFGLISLWKSQKAKEKNEVTQTCQIKSWMVWEFLNYHVGVDYQWWKLNLFLHEDVLSRNLCKILVMFWKIDETFERWYKKSLCFCKQKTLIFFSSPFKFQSSVFVIVLCYKSYIWTQKLHLLLCFLSTLFNSRASETSRKKLRRARKKLA